MNEFQRTEAWRQARLGKLTGSRIADATAKTKTGWSASRQTYMAELLCERLTGQPTISYVSKAMQDGIDREPAAITIYEFERNVTVDLVGFVPHHRIPMAGCSPDGVIGDDGAISVKCPLPSTHLETLLGASIDGGYIKQIFWEMGCTGRKWHDWVSYCPLFPPELQMEIRRIYRDDVKIFELEKQGEQFLAELDAKHQALIETARGRGGDSLRKALEASIARETAA